MDKHCLGMAVLRLICWLAGLCLISVHAEMQQVQCIVGGAFTFPAPVLSVGTLLYGNIGSVAMVMSRSSKTDLTEEFRGRLRWDSKTGLFTITDLQIQDSGQYKVDNSDGGRTVTAYQLTVYNRVSEPRLSASGSCWVLCSVENGRDVTLSWYRGTERLNQTSSPDLSTSLSLPLEIWEDSPAYSCVATNPVSEEAAEGNIKQLCAELGPSPMPRMYIIPAIPAVLIPTAVMLMIGFICLAYSTKKSREIKASEAPPNSTLSVGVYIPAPVNPRSLLKQHPGCMRTAAARDGDSGGQTLSWKWDSLLTAITYTEEVSRQW